MYSGGQSMGMFCEYRAESMRECCPKAQATPQARPCPGIQAGRVGEEEGEVKMHRPKGATSQGHSPCQ